MGIVSRAAWCGVLCITGCAGTTGTARPESQQLERASMVVALRVPAEGPVKVHLTVPRARLPEVPGQVRFSWTGALQEDAARHVRGALTPRTVSRQRDLELDYEVAVDRFPSGRGLYASVDLPHGRQLELRNLLPFFQGAVRSAELSPVVVTVESPLSVTSSLAGARGVYVAESPVELYTAVVLAGPTQEVITSDGLRVVSFDYSAKALAPVVEVVQRASKALAERYGKRRPLTLLTLNATPPGAPPSGAMGVNAGPFSTVLFDSPPSRRLTSMDNNRLLHELVHSSLPPEEGLPRWMTEGFAEFVARRLGIELEGLGPEVLREGLSSTWDSFVLASPSRRPDAANIASYYGGAVLAYCIDERLRRDKSSLDAVLKKVRQRADGEITNALWEQEIALASAAAGALVLMAKTAPLDPVASCFAEEGYVRQAPRKGVSLGFLRKAFGVTLLDAEPRHSDVMVMGVVDGQRPLREGDIITAVDGVRVVSVPHLQHLLAARPESPSVTLEISRGGALQSVTVPLGPLGARDTVEVDRALWLRKSAP